MILKSKRLTLRSLSQNDWALISYLRTNPDVNKYVQRSSAPTKEKAYAFISKIENGIQNNKLQFWVIVIESTQDSIGTICLWNYSDDMKSVELGYELNPKYQGKGYMTESLNLVITYAFDTMKFQTVEAYTHVDNKKSTSLLEKNNFVSNQFKKDEDNENNIVYELKVKL